MLDRPQPMPIPLRAPYLDARRNDMLRLYFATLDEVHEITEWYISSTTSILYAKSFNMWESNLIEPRFVVEKGKVDFPAPHRLSFRESSLPMDRCELGPSLGGDSLRWKKLTRNQVERTA